MTDVATFAPTDAPLSWGLAAAIEAGTAEPIDWIEVDLVELDLRVTVPRLPLRRTINGRLLACSAGYREQVRVARALACVSPTHALLQALWRAAPVRLTPKPLVITPTDSLHMGDLAYLTRENDAFEAQLVARAAELADPTAFARGFAKAWIVDLLMEALGLTGAANEGMEYPDGHELQSPGGRHNWLHLDYSQWIWDLLRRWAVRISTGEPVDLLELQCQEFPALAGRLRAEYGP